MLQELIKEWREFMIINDDDDDNELYDDDFLAPSFYDFMQWLSDKYK